MQSLDDLLRGDETPFLHVAMHGNSAKLIREAPTSVKQKESSALQEASAMLKQKDARLDSLDVNIDGVISRAEFLGTQASQHQAADPTGEVEPLSLRESAKAEVQPPITSAGSNPITSKEDEEDVQTIKAKMMYRMVEELPGKSVDCPRKLLLLSGKQADLITGSRDSIKRMLEIGFEIPPPRVVINILPSTFLTGDAEHLPGVPDGPAANRALDQFMADVLIPLAASTNAIIFALGFFGQAPACGLASSLTRMVSVMSAKWGRKPPFTVINIIPGLGALYRNDDPNATWRQIRDASTEWKKRDEHLNMLASELNWTGKLDIDMNAVNILAIDVSSDTELYPPGYKGLCNSLAHEMFSYLRSGLPSLVLKTGASGYSFLHDSATAGIELALDAMHGGSPCLFLDCLPRPTYRKDSADALADSEDRKQDKLQISEPRKLQISEPRPLIEDTTQISISSNTSKVAPLQEPKGDKRAALVNWAMKILEKEKASDHWRVFCLSACTLAWLHSVFDGDGDPAQVTHVNRFRGALEPLYQAIESMRSGTGEGTPTDKFAPATTKQRQMLCRYLAREGLQTLKLVDANDGSMDPEIKKPYAEHTPEERQAFESRETAFVIRSTMLTALEGFHSVNVCSANMEDVKKLVEGLVRLDRLPAQNSEEGLLLLKRAWDEHDIIHHLANQYKRLAKLFFFLQILLGFVIVCVSTVSYAEHEDDDDGYLYDVAFGLTVGSGFMVSLEAFLNAKSKWRQLRAFSGSLTSMIWQYRCRVPPFDTDTLNPDPSGPETRLRDTLVSWRSEMGSSADLQDSALRKKYSNNIFKHGQNSGAQCKFAHGDDHYSPVRADEYIRMRLRPMRQFYQQRIPARSRSRFCMKVGMLSVTVASAVLARYALGQWVAILTAFSSTLTSWTEFSDNARKIERYNRVIASIENLQTWWESISAVEKASVANTTHLIQTGESILSEERMAWQSTSGQKGSKEKEGKHDDKKEAVLPSTSTATH